MRIGIGYDVHAFSKERKLILGGVNIPDSPGLAGHSDADVLLHAICDAILGALGKGDIGKHFPNSEPEYLNISSLNLLKRVQEISEANGYSVHNIDSTIVAQNPKLAPYIPQMVVNIASTLKIYKDYVNVKATTTEHLGFIGKKEGIAAYAVVLLRRKNVFKNL